nr:alpha-E domain-containing protein [uncultured Cellulosilyticum sp.]
MGIIGVEKANHLFWLGRYTERVFTTLKVFFRYYDVMIEKEPTFYKDFCKRLSIPNVYFSKEQFVSDYLFDKDNPDSIYANLLRAYHNAVVMRNDLSSECLSYIQMALDVFENSKESKAPLVALQPVIDDIYAFWGSLDDYMTSDESRNMIKTGKYIERLDLYLRLSIGEYDLKKEWDKVKKQIGKIDWEYDRSSLEAFDRLCENQNYKVKDVGHAVHLLESIF